MMAVVTVRPAERQHSAAWLEMRHALWPEGSEAEHGEEIERYFRGDFPRDPWVTLVAEDPEGRILGFAELSIRPYAEGCRGPRVAYVEGWFVLPETRRRGVGRALIEATEAWARAQGCSELASDSYPENGVSAAAHGALGFEDVGLVRCFRKDI